MRTLTEQLLKMGITEIATANCFLVPEARQGPRAEWGRCTRCGWRGHIRTRRSCPASVVRVDSGKFDKNRALRYNRPLRRNDVCLELVKSVCRTCPALNIAGGGRCRRLAPCERSQWELYHAMLDDAHRWCPVWLEKLDLIRSIEDSRARIAAFVGGLDSGAWSLKESACTIPRGIVVCGGGEVYLPGTYVLLKMLRHLGCTLPIEVWHLGPEEMPGRWSERLVPLIGRGGAIRDGRQAIKRLDDEGAIPRASPQVPILAGLYGYELKLLALQWSAFREVLLLDADNMPVRDPTFLFDEPFYRETGALFWPDCHHASIWYAIGRDTLRVFGIDEAAYNPADREHETGQILVDKRRTWRLLHLGNWLAQNGRNWFFRYQLGDKDLLNLASRRLGQAVSLIPHGPLSVAEGCLVQTDPAGAVLFQHRIEPKLRLPAGENRRLRGFVGEDLCLEWLTELESSGSSPSAHAPD